MSKSGMLDSKEFGKEITGKQINFLIGSGASMPYIPTLNVEPQVFEEQLGENFESFKTKIFNDKKELSFEDVYKNEQAEEYRSDIDKVYYENILKKGFILPQQYDKYKNVLLEYETFIKNIIYLLDLHSVDVNKKANIFTTNYDLFFERAVDNVLANDEEFVFNDGFKGFINRKFNLYNYNMKYFYSPSYVNSTYKEQVKTINFYKMHGSLSWEKENEDLKYNYEEREEQEKISIIYPTKEKFRNTLMNVTYHNLLREYIKNIDFDSNVLMVFGFSFADEHIRDLTTRALKNPKLMIYIFCYEEKDFNEMYKLFGKYKNVRYVVTKKNFKNNVSKNLFYIDSCNNLDFNCFNTFLKSVFIEKEGFVNEK